jgi:hypothetical protein
MLRHTARRREDYPSGNTRWLTAGFGRWEREIMHVTAGVCVASVGGIVRAVVHEPCRDDHASARRAAKSLATKNQVAALYAWTCPGCYRVQDRSDLQVCCARPRSMLAVARPERRHLLRHPAPPPGGSAPWWLSAAPSAPAGLSVPGLDDLAALALRRLWDPACCALCPPATAESGRIAALKHLLSLLT